MSLVQINDYTQIVLDVDKVLYKSFKTLYIS